MYAWTTCLYVVSEIVSADSLTRIDILTEDSLRTIKLGVQFKIGEIQGVKM